VIRGGGGRFSAFRRVCWPVLATIRPETSCHSRPWLSFEIVSGSNPYTRGVLHAHLRPCCLFEVGGLETVVVDLTFPAIWPSIRAQGPCARRRNAAQLASAIKGFAAGFAPRIVANAGAHGRPGFPLALHRERGLIAARKVTAFTALGARQATEIGGEDAACSLNTGVAAGLADLCDRLAQTGVTTRRMNGTLYILFSSARRANWYRAHRGALLRLRVALQRRTAVRGSSGRAVCAVRKSCRAYAVDLVGETPSARGPARSSRWARTLRTLRGSSACRRNADRARTHGIR